MLIGLLGALALGVVLVASFAPTESARRGAPTHELAVGALAPDFELPNINTGQRVRLSSLRGKPVWVNFWATWCPPCKAELPIIKQKYDRYKDKGLVVVGVDMQENPSQVRAYIQSNGYDWAFVVDSDGTITNRFFTEGIPNHVFIDATGVVQAVHVGDLDGNAMEDLLSKVLH